jgi:hypothetical protein
MNDNAGSLNKAIGSIKVALTKPVEPVPVYRVGSKIYKDYAFLLVIVSSNTKGNERTLDGTDIPCITFVVNSYSDINLFSTVFDIYNGQRNRQPSQSSAVFKGFGLCIGLTLMHPTTIRVMAFKL